MRVKDPAAYEDALKTVKRHIRICRFLVPFMPSMDTVNAGLFTEPRSFFPSWAGVQKATMSVRFNNMITCWGRLVTISFVMLPEGLIFWYLYTYVMLFLSIHSLRTGSQPVQGEILHEIARVVSRDCLLYPNPCLGSRCVWQFLIVANSVVK